MNNIISIAALSENRVIADENGIPWDIPEDYQFYKSKVEGEITISGRKTYESGGESVKADKRVVLTRQDDWEPSHEDAYKATGAKEALDLAKDLASTTQDIYITGGEAIYREFLDDCDMMILSHIIGEYDGTRYYPEYSESNWEKIKSEEFDRFTIVWYERV